MGDFYEWEDYNFMWTQWKSNKIFNCLKAHQDITGGDKSGVSTAASESLLSLQPTDKIDSNSSVETQITTPTKKKKMST